ncbi:KilA-N domain-containing protein [Pseudomonas putida]|uniref:KilA-N domain-containing protein n=1 Tax=Pseudomonas putida TaxID=303 RepID=UPI001A8C4124|nr:KilA-N domain-containing protein [Pseudomonas putida]
MNNVIPIAYEGQPVQFNCDGWLHATKIAERFGKKPGHWLELDSTKEYIGRLSERMAKSNVGKSDITLVRTRRGNSSTSGSWLHSKLAVKFARWLSVDFEIWADEQIDALLRGSQAAMDVLNRACKEFDDHMDVASAAGRALNAWKRDKPVLIDEIERGRQLLQMTVGLNDPDVPFIHARR